MLIFAAAECYAQHTLSHSLTHYSCWWKYVQSNMKPRESVNANDGKNSSKRIKKIPSHFYKCFAPIERHIVISEVQNNRFATQPTFSTCFYRRFTGSESAARTRKTHLYAMACHIFNHFRSAAVIVIVCVFSSTSLNSSNFFPYPHTLAVHISPPFTFITLCICMHCISFFFYPCTLWFF